MERKLVEEYLDRVGAYYAISDEWKTGNGKYFLIKEDTSFSTVYVLRVLNGRIYNYLNEMVGINDLIHGVLPVLTKRESEYDRVTGSVIDGSKEFLHLDAIKREDGTCYALQCNKYNWKDNLSHYSELYEYDGRIFRFNKTDCLVSLLHKAGEEEIQEDNEWKEKHGSSLYKLVKIDGNYYSISETVGLGRCNWEDVEIRNSYLDEFIFDYANECSYLAEDFIKNELPLYTKEEINYDGI